MLLQYAREHHFPNPTFFVDDGVSGVTYDRPGFQAMLAEIEAGRVAVAIAKDLSRLGRNSALTGLYTNFTFPQNGVRFIAINDNYDTIDPNRVDNDFAGIKNWFNEFYARDTSRKIRAVQKAKGERGVPLTTNVPYGYVKDLENPRRWVVDPVAADVVKRIFDLCMKGRGPMQIANQLKADKVLAQPLRVLTAQRDYRRPHIPGVLRHLPYRLREILYLAVSVPQPVLAVLLDAGAVGDVVDEILLLILRLHVVFPHLLDERGGAALGGVIQIFLVLNEFPAGGEGLQQPCNEVLLLFCGGERTALIRQQFHAGTGGDVAGTLRQLRGVLSALEVGRNQYDPGHASSGSIRRWLRTAFSKLT